ncbi:MAG: tetratricopeptide repeat protein [Nitrospirae bacterium]|nr:tetratricopeptide repeat protein [Nitrospirota bacterium]
MVNQVQTNLSQGSSLSKGIEEYKDENFEEALEIFIKARKEDPSSSLAAFYLGLTYKQLMNYKEASVNLRDAIKLEPAIKEAVIELIEVLYNLNEIKEAKEWLNIAEKEGIKPAQTAFLKGLILLKENNNLEAIRSFEKSKQIDPSLATPADFQIGIAYLKEKNLKEAREKFRAIVIVSPESDLSAFAREYEDAITKRLALEREWRFNAGIAYQYDDNVILNPEIEIAGIPKGEDWATVATFNAGYTPRLLGPWTINTQYSLYINRHRRIETHDIMSHTLTIVPGYNFRNSSFNLFLSYNYTWLNDQRYLYFISASPQLNIALGENHIGQVSAGYSKKEFIWTETTTGISIGPDEDRDADVFDASIGWIYLFSGGRGFMNLKYEFSSENTDGRNWSYIGNRGSANILIPLLANLRMNISGEVFHQNYRDVHTIFGIKRRDKIYSASGVISYEFYKGASFLLQYAHIRDDSNIPIYDYKRNIYSAGIEYRF